MRSSISDMADAFDNARPQTKTDHPDDASWLEPDLSLLADDQKPEPEFDWESVSPNWHAWLRGMSEDTGAPAVYIFANLLGIASGVIGNARRVSPWPGWVEQPHLWIANVGNPSSLKTPALTPFKHVCAQIEREELPAHSDAVRQWETKCAAAEATKDVWQQQVKIAAKNRKPLPEKPASADEPARPTCREY